MESRPESDAYKQDVENKISIDDKGFEPEDEKASENPDIIDWDGPDDPANPMNWPFSKKFAAIGTVSFITLLS